MSPASMLRIFVWLAVVVLALAILANSMTKEIGRDEQMYVTAGVLLGQGQLIYKDFSYPSQLPYHPLLLAALYRTSSTTHYLMVGRLVSAISNILVVILILLIYRSVFARRSEGLWLGLAATALHVFNPFVDYAAGYAWNHDVVILCVVTALWLLLTTDFQMRSGYWRIGAIGALLTSATCMRVTTSLVELVFLGAIFWLAEGSLRNRIRATAPFLVAAFVASICPLLIIAQAPQAFWLNLVRIPTLYGRWLHELGMTLDKAALTASAALTPGYLVLLALAGILAWIGFRSRSSLNGQERRKAVLTTLPPFVFLLIAYIPPTMWLQYLAMPVPFIVIAFAYPLLAVRRCGPSHGMVRRVAGFAVPAAAVLSILAYPIVLSRTVFLLIPEKWEPIRLHTVSRAATRHGEEPKLVLTLGPLYALESGCDIYHELSCGDIVYRVADRLTPEERRLTNTVGPGTIDAMVKGRPPVAVIVGVEPSRFAFLEEPLRRVAQPDWPSEQVDSLTVYVRPRGP